MMPLSIQRVLYLVCFALLNLTEIVFSDCVKKGPCSCESSKGVVDLSKLGESIRFSSPQDDYTYQWSPCVATQCGTFADTSVCQVFTKDGTAYCAGLLSSATFIGEPEKNLQIKYECKDSTTTRTSYVSLVCDNSVESQFVAKGTVPGQTTEYAMTLTSKYACVEAGSLSGGSIILIVFFVLVLIYFIGGILFLHFVRGANGVEMIPNLEFWKDFPFLVRDGVRFLCRGCKADSTYSQI